MIKLNKRWMMKDIKNKDITSRDIDFAKWYTDVVRAAKLACV